MRLKASETRESAQVTKVRYWEKSQHEHAFNRKTRRRQRASKESEKGGGGSSGRSQVGSLGGGRSRISKSFEVFSENWKLKAEPTAAAEADLRYRDTEEEEERKR